ncbi:MAG: DinB family protein [Ardenticatenales bacterium]|nr:DinB family protein [Ardenticatenales bacterium]
MERHDALRGLSETLPVLQTLLDTEETLLCRQPAEGWSAKEILGHLLDAIEVWDERVRLVVTEEHPFLESYDQEIYVRERNHQSAELRPALTARQVQRAATLARLNGLAEEAWSRTGQHEERGPITLDEMVRLMAVHEHDHLVEVQALITA